MSDIDYIMLEGEREELLRRLTSDNLNDLGIIERSFERRALRQRLAEIDADIASNVGIDYETEE
jgi:hypothetical protein